MSEQTTDPQTTDPPGHITSLDLPTRRFAIPLNGTLTLGSSREHVDGHVWWDRNHRVGMLFYFRSFAV